MKNIPRIYIDEPLVTGKQIKLSANALHYLKKVMRTDKFLAFNGGQEYHANLSAVGHATGRPDPSNNLTLAFAPIRQARLEEMLSMATQLGVAKLVPVVTERTNEHRTNWNRIKKIIIESSEQSGRNNVPELTPLQKFNEFIKAKNLFFADERLVHNDAPPTTTFKADIILIGPEGGFSDKEFAALDKVGATGISLGKTILRSETAAVVAVAKLIEQ